MVTVATPFHAAVNGFHFDNDFDNPIPVLKFSTHGRCGGMVFAGLDLFLDDRLPPPDTTVPPQGSPLADYIYRRLFDSWKSTSALRFVTWSIRSDSALEKFTTDELPGICRSLDAGNPVALGLITARRFADVGRNHQVLATGYSTQPDGSVALTVWDNNHHDIDTILTVTPGTPGVASSTRPVPWRALFAHTYTPQVPPDFA